MKETDSNGKSFALITIAGAMGIVLAAAVVGVWNNNALLSAQQEAIANIRNEIHISREANERRFTRLEAELMRSSAPAR